MIERVASLPTSILLNQERVLLEQQQKTLQSTIKSGDITYNQEINVYDARALLDTSLPIPYTEKSERMTFLNPIIPHTGDYGGDPWFYYKDGWYNYSHVSARGTDHSIYVTRSKSLTRMKDGNRARVWNADDEGLSLRHMWAPEIHWLHNGIDERWYMYFAASTEHDAKHNMYVLESKTEDPHGEYTFKGKIENAPEMWGIDQTVFRTKKGKLFSVWSGIPEGAYGQSNDGQQYYYGDQNLYLAEMETPWKIKGEPIQISSPTFDWERIGMTPVNEGPAAIVTDEKIFIVFAASHSTTDDYCWGMLESTSEDLLSVNSWYKHETPVFKKNSHAFGPGHPSFTVSPDGQEFIVAYHTAEYPGAGWRRVVNIQPFRFDTNGRPDFGEPIGFADPIQLPSGEEFIIVEERETEAARKNEFPIPQPVPILGTEIKEYAAD